MSDPKCDDVYSYIANIPYSEYKTIATTPLAALMDGWIPKVTSLNIAIAGLADQVPLSEMSTFASATLVTTAPLDGEPSNMNETRIDTVITNAPRSDVKSIASPGSSHRLPVVIMRSVGPFRINESSTHFVTTPRLTIALIPRFAMAPLSDVHLSANPTLDADTNPIHLPPNLYGSFVAKGPAVVSMTANGKIGLPPHSVPTTVSLIGNSNSRPLATKILGANPDLAEAPNPNCACDDICSAIVSMVPTSNSIWIKCVSSTRATENGTCH